MSRIEQGIDVNVPVRTAYNQWTQFEEFPNFMEGVVAVKQIDPCTLEWRARVGGKEKRWLAEIAEQIPDARIAWHATEGSSNAGVVTFHRLADDKTRVMLQMEYEPERLLEKVGDALGLLQRRVDGDLARFKTFVEQQGDRVDGWPGTVPAKPDAAQKRSTGSPGDVAQH